VVKYNYLQLLERSKGNKNKLIIEEVKIMDAKFVRLFWAIPTWLIVRLLTPVLPATHKWKKKRWALQDWAKGRTDLTEKIDGLLLAMGVGLAMYFNL
jgi:hypothetical protein